MAKARATSKPSGAPVRDAQGRIPDVLGERIEPLLPPRPPHRLRGHNPRVPDRKARVAIVFVRRTGCPWKALNGSGICSSSAAHRRFPQWTSAGVLVPRWAEGLEASDAWKGRDWESWAREGARTKAPRGGERTGTKPTARGKPGAKRRLRRQAHGVAVGLAVQGAHRQDQQWGEATLERSPGERPAPTAAKPPGRCRDKGDDWDDSRALVRQFGLTAQVGAWGAEAKAWKRAAGFKARRWVVARPQSWMNRFRRILMRWEKKVENDFGMLHLVCAFITYRCSGLLG